MKVGDLVRGTSPHLTLTKTKTGIVLRIVGDRIYLASTCGSLFWTNIEWFHKLKL